MISKKLLSEVFNEKVLSYNVINKTEIIVQFFEHDEVINIYELAHKCKEWAFKNGFCISEIDYLFSLSKPNEPDFRANVWCILDNHKALLNQTPEKPCAYFDEPTQNEAIFKACEWIMENTK